MALKKTCRCGKIIDYYQTRCEGCTKALKQNKQRRNKQYDRHQRDKEGQKFYTSKEWQKVREIVKQRDKGLCKLCFSNKKITYADMVHHIEERTENKEKQLDVNNLICLCNSCHNYVHGEYNNGNKKKMQERLKELIKG